MCVSPTANHWRDQPWCFSEISTKRNNLVHFRGKSWCCLSARISSGFSLRSALHAVSLEGRLAGRDLQPHRTSLLCPLFMERCLGLAYVNEGWEDDGEKWRSRSRRGDREAAMQGGVLNDREQGGEKSVHNRQHSEKHPRDLLFNLPEHVFMALKLCAAPTPRLPLLFNLYFQSLSLPKSHPPTPPNTHTQTHSDKRMNHPLRLLIKTIIEQQREQDKRKGRGGAAAAAAACYQILLSYRSCTSNLLCRALIRADLGVNLKQVHHVIM